MTYVVQPCTIFWQLLLRANFFPFNSLAPRIFGSHFLTVVTEHMLWINFMGISCEIALTLMSQNTPDDKSLDVRSGNALVLPGSKPLLDPDQCRYMASLGHNDLNVLPCWPSNRVPPGDHWWVPYPGALPVCQIIAIYLKIGYPSLKHTGTFVWVEHLIWRSCPRIFHLRVHDLHMSCSEETRTRGYQDETPNNWLHL